MNSTWKKLLRPEELLNFSSARRLPIIRQTELAECGLACLGMIAGYYGFNTDITQLRKRHAISGKGSSLKTLIAMASSMHLTPRALRVEPENLKYVQLPCIAHWGLAHFVVIKAVKKNTITLHDPSLGERRLRKSDFDKEFTGVILELNPTQNFSKGSEKQQLKLSDFWSKIFGLKRSLAQLLALSVIMQVFSVISPFYMQTVVDDVLLRKDLSLLLVLSLGFGLLILIQMAVYTLREFITMHISNRLAMQMSANLFHHLIRLPLEYFEKRHMGDIVSRFSSLNKVRELLTHSLVSAIIDGIMAMITLIAMFFYNIQLACIVMGILAIYGVMRWSLFYPSRMLSEEQIIAAAKESSHFMESIRAIQTIKILQREFDRQNQWQNHLADSMNKSIRLTRWGIFFEVANAFIFSGGNLIVVYVAAISVMNNSMSLGMLFAFMSYKSSFESTLTSLISKWIDLKMLNIHLDRLSDIAFTPIENIDRNTQSSKNHQPQNTDVLIPNKISEHKLLGKIEVRNLCFRYGEHEPYVFENINFVIYPGETVAFIGASGAGKTTLMKCLMGLIEPTKGEIFIDNCLLKNISYFRGAIAGVMQDDQLLAGDIADNISCFESIPDMDKIYSCAIKACIHSEILKMPMQYYTLVGDMGSSLSGGQKQRIILARALYREPSILFMDEATSHLDVKNEAQVNDNIKQLNITRLIVAHRPETVSSASRTIDITAIN